MGEAVPLYPLAHEYPSARRSWRYTLENFVFPLRNPLFGLATGILSWVALHQVTRFKLADGRLVERRPGSAPVIIDRFEVPPPAGSGAPG